MPSFAGLNLFGIAVTMSTADNPRERQENSFPGLSGVESLDMGSRGRFTSVEGTLMGADAAELGQMLTLFRSFKDNRAYVLVDMFNDGWPYVMLDVFQPIPPVHSNADGRYWQKYRARFYHLL